LGFVFAFGFGFQILLPGTLKTLGFPKNLMLQGKNTSHHAQGTFFLRHVKYYIPD